MKSKRILIAAASLAFVTTAVLAAEYIDSLDSVVEKKAYCNSLAKVTGSMALGRDEGKTKAEIREIIADLRKKMSPELVSPFSQFLNKVFADPDKDPQTFAHEALLWCADKYDLEHP